MSSREGLYKQVHYSSSFRRIQGDPQLLHSMVHYGKLEEARTLFDEIKNQYSEEQINYINEMFSTHASIEHQF